MTDARLERYAQVVCDHCLRLGPGQRLAILAPPVASPLVLALARAAFARGVHVGVVMETPFSRELLLRLGTEGQLAYGDPWLVELVDQADAAVEVLAATNSRALTSVPPERIARHAQAFAPVGRRVQERLADGSLLWCACAYPTASAAQDAQMGTPAFERLVYRACLLDEADPVAAWCAVGERQARVIERLARAEEVRVRGPGTDLRVCVAGRPWENAAGGRNLPDGEISCSPHAEATEGEIRFALPIRRDGRLIEDVRLRFRRGRAVEASAAIGEELLLGLLDTDEGSRRVGEFALGMNGRLQQATGSAILDAKMAGTCHLALGRAFLHLRGENESAIHWDLVCDLREGGSVEADGEAILRDGRLLY